MNFGLKNKIAVVAAASRGLGRAAARQLALEGATVVICSRRKKEITQAAREIEEESGSVVVAVRADVTKPKDVQNLVSQVKKRFGTVHVLVNNAGGPPAGEMLTLTDKDWQKAHELTLMSMVRLTRAVLPMMVRQQWGRIITINSIVAKQPINELLLSSAIRPGIGGLTKVLANRYAKHQITVNTVCPGHIRTQRQEELARVRAEARRISVEQYFAETAASIPAARLGRPEEIGSAVAFLASEQAAYINGVNLLVDGSAARGIY
ncbi:MAG TPA: SDR family oxidoreductase [Smithellaceae bacterium]|nr:SDR family oxidoreductase [Smithellaceae bacterium]HRS83499.1 SDR family oxidoreductase [Smithellaceae bacterium]HRV44774.1 SDR family oxidoreductase [Smithellaceae bacterium]